MKVKVSVIAAFLTIFSQSEAVKLKVITDVESLITVAKESQDGILSTILIFVTIALIFLVLVTCFIAACMEKSKESQPEGPYLDPDNC